jgi:hypothetical protein
MDAIQSERMANEILLDSIADRRVRSPSWSDCRQRPPR